MLDDNIGLALLQRMVFARARYLLGWDAAFCGPWYEEPQACFHGRSPRQLVADGFFRDVIDWLELLHG